MSTLLESSKSQVHNANEALVRQRKFKQLVILLPKEIQELNGTGGCWEADYDKEHPIHVNLNFYQSENKDIDLVKFFKMQGFQGIVLKNYGSKDFCADGTAIIAGMQVSVSLYSLPKPDNCILEEYQEMTTKYRSKCAEEVSKDIELIPLLVTEQTGSIPDD